MIQFLRSGNPASFFAFTITILIVRLPTFFFDVEVDYSPTLPWLNTWLNNIHRISILDYFISSVFLLLQGFWLNSIFEKNNLLGKKTYLIYFFYALLCSIHPSILSFDVFHILAFALIFVLDRCIRLYQAKNSDKIIFNISFFLATTSLMLPSILLVMIAVFIAIQSFRNFEIRDYLLALLGAATPIYLCIGSMYLFDADYQQFFQLWKSNVFKSDNFHLSEFLTESPIFLLLLIGLLFPLNTFLVRLGVNKIRTIKILTWSIWMLVILFFSQFAVLFDLWKSLPFAAIILSLILSIYFIQTRREKIAFAHILLFGLVFIFNILEVLFLKR